MKEEKIAIGSRIVPVYRYSVLVAGTGAAGLNAADTLYDSGARGIAIITEGLKAGTSRNTGSDKQTYYKLSLAGDANDSVRALAETLFAGGATDGDIALCEAAASVPCFTKLARLGIPFPKNRWGEYVGYKTDHDPARRATSAGPYTSKFMTEALEAQVLSKGIPVFAHFQIVKLLTTENRVAGILCLDLEAARKNLDDCFALFLAPWIILATGGPAVIYDNTVYPESQNGASGAAFEAGAAGRNLTEWQYGLASVKPRWNVSGTFMQVLPRFISTDSAGNDEREFLPDYFSDFGEMLSLVFLKGYQWPFDSRKIRPDGNRPGSSIIDILVYLESAKGRRVFLDFRTNPKGLSNSSARNGLDFSILSDEARAYLEAAGACFGTPIQRLEKMNKPAAEFYKARGTDLSAEPLEIALCAQHNNGGLAVDCWWRSNIEGLFPVGEAAATHGVYRPGGSALNAGQAGSYRAALFIANELRGASQAAVSSTEISSPFEKQIREIIEISDSVIKSGPDNVKVLLADFRKRMSLAGGAFRDSKKILEALEAVRDLRKNFIEKVNVSAKAALSDVFRLWDILVCQEFYLSAMADYAAQSGKSRGSALYQNDSGTPPLPGLDRSLAFVGDDGKLNGRVQEIYFEKGQPKISWRGVRPIPPADESFELVWSEFREKNLIV